MNLLRIILLILVGPIAFFVFLRDEFSSSKGLRAENPSGRRGWTISEEGIP